MGRLSKDGLFEIIQYDLSMQSRRSVNYYQCPISIYVQFINKVVLLSGNGCYKKQSHCYFQKNESNQGSKCLCISFFLNKYVLVYKIY